LRPGSKDFGGQLKMRPLAATERAMSNHDFSVENCLGGTK
jgi:hypothetical protein